jgi:hypothetical protein
MNRKSANSRFFSYCMVAISAFMAIVILIGETALAAALIAAVIDNSHPSVFVFLVSSMILAAMFIVAVRVLTLELAEYQRTASSEESAFLMEDHNFTNCRPV